MTAPPLARGLPLIGNALRMLDNPLAYLVACHTQYGNIFRMRLFGREATVLAGLEANRLLMSMGADLAKGKMYTGFEHELGENAHFSIVDGDPHLQLRRAVRPGYSRRRYEPCAPMIQAHIQAHLANWQYGQVVPVVRTIERLMGTVLGTLLTFHPSGDHFDDFQTVIKLLHYVYPMRLLPKIVLNLPPYRSSKQRIFAFAKQIIAHHRDFPVSERRRTLVDDLLDAHADSHLTDAQLIGQVFTPFFVGVDTVGATLSFLLYLLLKYPSVYRAITAEIDGATQGDSVDLMALPTLDSAIHETLRLYPIAPMLVRRAMTDFTFEGYAIPVGTDLIMAVGVTHYQTDYYPQPTIFDITRNQDVPAGVFTTWGMGPHTCLGAGLADMLMKQVMVTLLQNWHLSLYPTDYTMKLSLKPLPNPGKSFRMRVERRNQ